MGLFDRFSKRHGAAKDSAPAPDTEGAQLSDAEREDIAAEADHLRERLRSAAEADRPELLDALGAVYERGGQTDDAIDSYEQSLALKEAFGPAYNRLLELYNAKRADAAAARDDAGIQTWTGKLDGLLALSKHIMRSNY